MSGVRVKHRILLYQLPGTYFVILIVEIRDYSYQFVLVDRSIQTVHIQNFKSTYLVPGTYNARYVIHTWKLLTAVTATTHDTPYSCFTTAVTWFVRGTRYICSGDFDLPYAARGLPRRADKPPYQLL